MKTQLTIIAALVAGGFVSGVAVQGLRAQGKPLVYVVVDIRSTNNPDALKTIAEKAAASSSVADFGGKTIIRTNEITAFDGAAPKRFVLIAFDSVDKARAWHESPGQKAVEAVRMKLTDSSQFMVQGVTN
ncbi:MAG TPA: DUF1330 domain-containing protein [Roseiarcus sp.]|nr:DUF1330 domain-containing protein [Roseiarcus sp.]